MRRIRKAKLYVRTPGGEWKEVKGVQFGDCAFEFAPPADPVDIPGLRDFAVTLRCVSPLIMPPLGSDPSKN